MRVRDLISKLQQYAEANPEVVFTYEGVRSEIDEGDVYVSACGEIVIGSDYRDTIENSHWPWDPGRQASESKTPQSG